MVWNMQQATFFPISFMTFPNHLVVNGFTSNFISFRAVSSQINVEVIVTIWDKPYNVKFTQYD